MMHMCFSKLSVTDGKVRLNLGAATHSSAPIRLGREAHCPSLAFTDSVYFHLDRFQLVPV
jgi:hypothetical protein